MVLNSIGSPLQLEERPVPQASAGQVVVKVLACGVCRTDLHLIDGELPDIRTPIIPGHEIVGTIEEATADGNMEIGTLVGVPWLGWTCGVCEYCQNGLENLCDVAKFTGYQLDGGYCEYTKVDHRFCIPIDSNASVVHLAPYLCAGLIGYRCLKSAQRLSQRAENIGIFGFGAAAHIVAQLISLQGNSFYAFTRPGDKTAQQFACELGAKWAGDSDMRPPIELDAAIIFAPVGELVPRALRTVRKGGAVVCGGIHMSEIPAFPYEILWGERQICSVANLTRDDGREFFEMVAHAPIKTHTQSYALADANHALYDLRNGRLRGAAVLTM